MVEQFQFQFEFQFQRFNYSTIQPFNHTPELSNFQTFKLFFQLFNHSTFQLFNYSSARIQREAERYADG